MPEPEILKSRSTTAKPSMEFTILGQRIPIRTSEKDPELVAEISSMVSLLLKNAELRTTRSGAVAHQVALLALLDLAQEYVKAKRRTATFKRNVTEKSARLTELVQDTLK